jgi:hypothetical protein
MAPALGKSPYFHGQNSTNAQLHYIPVSQLYSEIYNIHAYFSGPSKAMTKALNGTTNGYQASTMSTKRLDGDAELRKIASAGRDWMFKHGRKVDMESKSFRVRYELR